MEDRIYQRPRRRLMFGEAPRAAADIAALSMAAPFLYSVPRGDRHPVLVMPGLGAGDGSTTVIRGYLDSLGYNTYPWTLGRNRGPAMPNLAGDLSELLDSVFNDAGERKVSLIGWSLGGVYARMLAQLSPQKIRSVITLGSPFAGSPRSTAIYPAVRRLLDMPVEKIPVHHLRLLAGQPLEGVPSTAIFSRNDAIVPWQIATQQPSENAENIEVFTGHLGLGVSPAVLYATADRLRLAEGQWQPFVRSGWKRAVYGAADLRVNAGPSMANPFATA